MSDNPYARLPGESIADWDARASALIEADKVARRRARPDAKSLGIAEYAALRRAAIEMRSLDTRHHADATDTRNLSREGWIAARRAAIRKSYQ